MNNIYTAPYTLRSCDFGIYSRLRPASILELFQDVAGRHSICLGCGTADLMKKGLAWVLVRQRCRILSEAQMHQSVLVSTWPLAPGRVGYRREYRLSSQSGRVIAEGSSEWVIIDIASRRIVPSWDIYPLDSFRDECIFPDGFPRLHSFQPEAEPYRIKPAFSDFDMNGHVNNTKYANYVLDAISPRPEEVISAFRLDFHREILPGTEVNIVSHREGDLVFARGESTDGEKMFSCCVEFSL